MFTKDQMLILTDAVALLYIVGRCAHLMPSHLVIEILALNLLVAVQRLRSEHRERLENGEKPARIPRPPGWPNHP